MKFLFVGDPHNQVRTPANRTDDFHATYQKKVDEIKKIAKEEEVSAILQPGDFLNQPNYNNDFLMEVINKWSFVPEKYALLEQLRTGKGDIAKIAQRLQEDIPYIGAIGNHELVGESLKSYPRTSLAFLEKLGFMTMASKEEPIIFTDDDGTKIAITATHYHHGMDKPEHVDDYIIDKKSGDIHIHMVHGYLAHKNLGDLITHTLVDAIKETKADVTLAGHDHVGFKPVTIDGKLFANPGSMTRTKADVKEISRDIKVLIIEVADGKVSLTERKLETAPAGKEVLDRTLITAKASRSAKIESIKSIVKKAGLSKGQTVTDIIESVAKAGSIDESITEDVVERVTDKIEDMGKKETATVASYKLSQIVLENFQSHKHSVFDVDGALNIFTGESSNGKSAVMRAMRWLMDNHGKSQRESYINHNADRAKVTAVFDNGLMVSRVLDRKAHGENGWQIFDPSTGETETGNTQLAEQVRELFGYTKVQYDTSDALDVNFMNQGDGWYFIGDHVKSSERAKVIGAIFGTHYTDAVMKDLEKDMRSIRSEVRVREKDLKATTEAIESFDYLGDVEKRLEEAQTCADALGELQDRHKDVSKLIARKEALDKQKEVIDTFLAESTTLTAASDELDNLKVLAERHVTVKQLLIKRSQIIRDGKSSRHLVESLKELDEASRCVAELDTLNQHYSTVVSLSAKQEKVHTQIKQEQALVTKQTDVVQALQAEYKQLLDQSGICPTCGQAVDSNALDAHLTHM